MKFYNQKFIHPSKPVKHKDLQGIMQTLHSSWFQGPVTTPSQMKDILQAEFRADQTKHLNEPIYIVETQYTTNFEQFQLQNPVSSTPKQ